MGMKIAINATIVTGIPTNRALQKLIRVTMKQARLRKMKSGPRRASANSKLFNGRIQGSCIDAGVCVIP